MSQINITITITSVFHLPFPAESRYRSPVQAGLKTGWNIKDLFARSRRVLGCFRSSIGGFSAGRTLMNWTTDHRQWYRKVYLHSDHWKSLRARKLEANPRCERCGGKNNLEPHHVNYRQLFDVELSDLLTLCRPCHTREHEANGMPRRQKISYREYFPDPAKQKIEEQRALWNNSISPIQRRMMKEKMLRANLMEIRKR